jgi:hypothetical protein
LSKEQGKIGVETLLDETREWMWAGSETMYETDG